MRSLTWRSALAILAVVALAGCAVPTPTPAPAPSATLALAPKPTPSPTPPPTPGPSPTPSPAASPVVDCASDTGVPDECPSAIVAFEAVAARHGSISKISIDPGPFMCGQPWPVASTPVCAMAPFLPGTAMHGYATFPDTDKVAAIALSRSRDGTTFGPWKGILVDFAVPPAGWLGP